MKIKSISEINNIKKSCNITKKIFCDIQHMIVPGVSTYELDAFIRKNIISYGGVPAFLGHDGFPASACISIDEEIVHGIPSKNVILKDGQIVSIDIGTKYNGWYSDCARTFCVGNVNEEKKYLIKITEESFFYAINNISQFSTIGDIGYFINKYITDHKLSVVKQYGGHGIGKKLHEAPFVPNVGIKGDGEQLCPGVVLAIEPMTCYGSGDFIVDKNNWTVRTKDNTLSSHYENTIAVTENGIEILTL